MKLPRYTSDQSSGTVKSNRSLTTGTQTGGAIGNWKNWFRKIYTIWCYEKRTLIVGIENIINTNKDFTG